MRCLVSFVFASKIHDSCPCLCVYVCDLLPLVQYYIGDEFLIQDDCYLINK